MGALHNFLRNNFRAGEWIGQYCTPRQHNRIANILQDIQGLGCRIEKPTNAEGRGWKIVVDGSSDITPPKNYPSPDTGIPSALSSGQDTSPHTAGTGLISFTWGKNTDTTIIEGVTDTLTAKVACRLRVTIGAVLSVAEGISATGTRSASLAISPDDIHGISQTLGHSLTVTGPDETGIAEDHAHELIVDGVGLSVVSTIHTTAVYYYELDEDDTVQITWTADTSCSVSQTSIVAELVALL